MDPGTLAITSAVVGGAGSLINGYTNSRNAANQATAAEYNANLADRNAGIAYQQGVAREEQQRRQSAQQLGAQRAAVSESGFDPSSGSALDVQVQSTGSAELDALQTRYQGILQANSYEEQARQSRMQAAQYRSNAKTALIGGVIGAGTSALMGYSSFARLGAAGGVGATSGYASRSLMYGFGG
ncbi:virion core protein, T7 gp14 family [Chitinasiproducens palmae]|uniref:Phage protein n=1 Tax=Chitinasiproducens palmae TaxID=1770053 RepID=A0A1H2PQV2_9BURK|nr:hypothetical protein [Chitinasiproducens palmae]SDV49187.1 hypothetical protein SAMN05216551_107138 [Chitinasiproducens palmae]